MTTRNGDAANSTVPKKTPPRRKTATRGNSTPVGTATLTAAETKCSSGGQAKQPSTVATTHPQVTANRGFNPEKSAAEEDKATADPAVVAPIKRTLPSGRISGVNMKQMKTSIPSSRKVTATKTPNCQDAHNARAEDSRKDVEDVTKEELANQNVKESPMKEQIIIEVEEPFVENVVEGTEEEDAALEDDDEPVKEEQTLMDAVENLGDSLMTEEHVMEVGNCSEKKESNCGRKDLVVNSMKQNKPAIVELVKFSENQSSFLNNEEDYVKQNAHVVEVAKPNDNIEAIFQYQEEEEDEDPEEELKTVDDKEDPVVGAIDKVENMKNEFVGDSFQSELDDNGSYEEYGDRVDYGEHEEEAFADDEIEEPADETETLEEERRELNAIAKDRKSKKEHEIFVGGLDHDATEEDVGKVFERIGEILEVRLHKNFSTNRNKGYAFVKFANKEHAKRALSEMKNPVICGKRCGTAPSEDNDTLFVGNICNSWTKEAIKQKLKDYGVDGVENVNLVPDIQHEGLSRGFAFVVFSCHVDAMAAYKRLQKPDVVFGHPERTVKVAFAEPLREPDPEIMANVKTVFLDGVPPHWNENQIREQIKGNGDILRIVLARSMSTARRKDYGFIDFSSHEAAVACITGINNQEFNDGNSKLKLKARLSNPMPKIQAVKGGMSGGFRIGHGGSVTFSRFGRGSRWTGHHFNRENSQRGRDYNRHGRGRINRNSPNGCGFDNRYTGFRGGQFIGRGGRRGSFRGGYNALGRDTLAAGPSRPFPARLWPYGLDRGYGEHHSYRRQSFCQGSDFDRPFIRRQVDDPYFCHDRAHGVKRPFPAVDHEPDYIGPNRFRARLDYNDPPIPFYEHRHHDNFGSRGRPYLDDYHVPNNSAYPPYTPYYGDDRSYGGGYFY